MSLLSDHDECDMHDLKEITIVVVRRVESLLTVVNTENPWLRLMEVSPKLIEASFFYWFWANFCQPLRF
jgi:hypothetical protein